MDARRGSGGSRQDAKMYQEMLDLEELCYDKGIRKSLLSSPQEIRVSTAKNLS